MNMQGGINKKLDLKPFFTQYAHIKYERGERIIRPNELTANVILVKSGFLKIYRVSKNEKETIINIINSTSYNALILGFTAYIKKYSISALTDVDVIRMPKKDFLDYLQKHPEGYSELLHPLSRCLEIMYGQVEILKSGNAYYKIAAIIHYLGKETGTMDKKTVKLGFRITHQMIANLTGLTRETVTVQLNKLRAKQYIEYEDNILKIKNIDTFETLIKNEHQPLNSNTV